MATTCRLFVFAIFHQWTENPRVGGSRRDYEVTLERRQDCLIERKYYDDTNRLTIEALIQDIRDLKFGCCRKD